MKKLTLSEKLFWAACVIIAGHDLYRGFQGDGRPSWMLGIQISALALTMIPRLWFTFAFIYFTVKFLASLWLVEYLHSVIPIPPKASIWPWVYCAVLSIGLVAVGPKFWGLRAFGQIESDGLSTRYPLSLRLFIVSSLLLMIPLFMKRSADDNGAAAARWISGINAPSPDTTLREMLCTVSRSDKTYLRKESRFPLKVEVVDSQGAVLHDLIVMASRKLVDEQCEVKVGIVSLPSRSNGQGVSLLFIQVLQNSQSIGSATPLLGDLDH
jgi:hypothetical protein